MSHPAALERFDQSRDLGTHPTLRQLSEHHGVAFTRDEHLDHRPARLGPHLRRHRRQLDARVLEQLLESLDLLAPSPDLGLAVAGQLPQPPDLRRRHQTRADHPMGGHISEPLRVRHVGLASRHVLDVIRVHQPQLVETVLQPVEDRPPVHAGGLHHHQLNLSFGEPPAKVSHPGRGRRERRLVDLHRRAVEQLDTRRHRVSMDIKPSDPIMDPSHNLPPSAQGPSEGNQGRFRIWGSCSKQHSPVPRIPHQTLNGLNGTKNQRRPRPDGHRDHFISPRWPPRPGHHDFDRY